MYYRTTYLQAVVKERLEAGGSQLDGAVDDTLGDRLLGVHDRHESTVHGDEARDGRRLQHDASADLEHRGVAERHG